MSGFKEKIKESCFDLGCMIIISLGYSLWIKLFDKSDLKYSIMSLLTLAMLLILYVVSLIYEYIFNRKSFLCLITDYLFVGIIVVTFPLCLSAVLYVNVRDKFTNYREYKNR